MGTRIRALERQHGVMGAVGASPYVHFWCLIVLTAHEIVSVLWLLFLRH